MKSKAIALYPKNEKYHIFRFACYEKKLFVVTFTVNLNLCSHLVQLRNIFSYTQAIKRYTEINVNSKSKYLKTKRKHLQCKRSNLNILHYGPKTQHCMLNTYWSMTKPYYTYENVKYSTDYINYRDQIEVRLQLFICTLSACSGRRPCIIFSYDPDIGV